MIYKIWKKEEEDKQMDLTYLQYFFNWICPFVLNIQWQVIVSFNLHILLS